MVFVGVTAAITALGVAVAPAAAVVSPDAAARRPGADQAKPSPADQIALADRLHRRIDSAWAGAAVDRRTERLVVYVTSERAADRVRATPARARVVDYSFERLTEIQHALQRHAVTGTVLAVDAAANVVRVTIPRDTSGPATRALLRRARSFGDAVEVSRVARTPRPMVLYGGEAIYAGGSRCSAAFVATRGGSEYVITAGHCTNIGGSWTVDEGFLGSAAASQFPGSDYGTIANSGGVATSGAVLRNGSPYAIEGATQPVQGMRVCKTGSTTGTTCGTITAYPVSVSYPRGTVRDLIQSNVCVQPGDSGGALYTSTGNQAVGIVSGGSTGGCGGGFVSFFENITEPLGALGLTLKGGDGDGDDGDDEEPPDTGTWEPYTSYQVGDRVTYNSQEYVCRQAHTSQPGWEPPRTPSLWSPV